MFDSVSVRESACTVAATTDNAGTAPPPTPAAQSPEPTSSRLVPPWVFPTQTQIVWTINQVSQTKVNGTQTITLLNPGSYTATVNDPRGGAGGTLARRDVASSGKSLTGIESR